MTVSRISNLRSAGLAGAALVALAGGAAAGDLPATPQGAQQIVAAVRTYAGPGAAAEPALTVKPSGAGYLVSVDVAALAKSLPTSGVSYEPATATFKAFAQDDGAWRIEMAELPALRRHQALPQGAVETTTTATGAKAVVVVDPALGWWRSGQFSSDKISINAKAPGSNVAIEVGKVAATASAHASADGVAGEIHKTFGPLALTMQVDPKIAKPDSLSEAKPVTISLSADQGAADAAFEGIRPKPLLAAWALALAPADRAANEAAVKTQFKAAAAAPLSLRQNVAIKGLRIDAPQGVISFTDFTFEFGASAAGAASHFDQRLAAKGLSLPDKLVPANLRPLAPNAFDIAVKIGGVDFTAALNDAIDDFHLTADGFTLSKADKDAIFAKILGAGPLTLDIAPSHLSAPQLDLAFEGRIEYRKGGKPTGRVTLHMRKFDETLAALKQLGPDAETKAIPALAMAKGLAKTEPDGQLTWICEITADGLIKINGLPLGRAPF